MSLPIFGAQAAVSILNRVFTNTSPAASVFNNQVSNAIASLPAGTDSTDVLSYTAFAKAFGTAYASQSPSALSTLILTNMGLLPNDGLQVGLADYLTNVGKENVGIVALQLSSIISGMGSSAIYGAASVAWNSEVTSAFTYSSNPANTTSQTGDVTAPPANQGQTFTLTTGQDNVQGTSGNDTINGVADGGATSNNNTLTASDVINGGAGKDSLMATLENATSGGVLPAAQYSNVENFFIRNVSGVNAANTFNFASVTGEEQVWNDRSNSNVTVTGLAAGTTVGVKGNATVVSATDATYVAGASAVNIALDGGLTATAGNAVTVRNAAGSTSLTSATVTSTGGTNNIAALNLAGTETALTIDAQTAFAVSDGVGATLEGINGAALTTITVKGAGAANLGSQAIGATVTTVNAADNAGGVTAVLSAGQNNVRFTGGSGNDVVTTSDAANVAGNLLATAAVDAGAGTADRLVIANTADITLASNVLSNAQGDLYKGFEQVQVQDGVTVSLARLATNNTIDTVRINDAAGAAGVTGLSAAQAANLAIVAANSTTGNITIGLTGATTAGQIDTVKAAVTTTTAANVAQNSDLSGVVLTGIENLELTGSNGAVATNVGSVTVETVNAIDLSSIKLNNKNAVDNNQANDNVITINAANRAINLNVDASGSGDTQINAGAYNTATGAALTTGAGNDRITASQRADQITTGAGSDTVLISNNTGNNQDSLTPVVDTITDFTVGNNGDVLDLTNLPNALKPVLNGTVNSTLVGSLTAALPTGGAAGTAELIVLDSSVTALQAANASALNGKLFNLAGAANQGQVLVAYSATAGGDVRIASANITGGDITAVNDLLVLQGVSTATLSSGFVAANLGAALTNFQAAGANLVANAAPFNTTTGVGVTGATVATAQNDTITATGAQADDNTSVIDGLAGTNTLNISNNTGAINLANQTTAVANIANLNLQLGSVATVQAPDLAGLNVTNVSGAATVQLGTVAQTYTGSTGVDTLQIVTASVAHTANLGDGADVLAPAGVAITGTYNGQGGTNSVTPTANNANISGATLSDFTTLDTTTVAVVNISTTVAQNNAFTTWTADANDSITLTNAGTINALTTAGNTVYVLSGAGANVFNANAAATIYNVTGGAGVADTFNFGATLLATDTINGGTGTDVLNVTATATGSANITNIETINFTTATAAQTLTTGAMDTGVNTTISAAASTVAVTIDAALADPSGATGTVTDTLTIIDGAGNDIISVPDADANRALTTVTLSTGGADRVNIANAAVGANTNAAVTINNFTAGIGAGADKIVVGAGVGVQILSAANAAVTTAAGNALIVTSAVQTLTDFTATTDNGAVETAIAAAVGTVANGSYTIVFYGSGAQAGNAAVYQFTTNASSADAALANVTALELVGVVNGVAVDSFVVGNFA